MKKNEKRDKWEEIFNKTLAPIHKQFTSRAVTKILKKTKRSYNSLISRSKRNNVEYKVTLDELRKLVNNNYNKKCKYCKKLLRINNYQIDHLIPISKGGPSNIENLEIICATCNRIKGSLSYKHFMLLLTWLNTQDKELSENIRLRLAGIKVV